MSDTTIIIMILVGFGVPLIVGATCLYFLWQTRHRLTLVFLVILHVICVSAFPALGLALGLVTWILMFFTPYADGYRPKECSFDDAFLDDDLG